MKSCIVHDNRGEAQKRVARCCLRFRFEGILRFRGAALSESYGREGRLERGEIIFSRYAEHRDASPKDFSVTIQHNSVLSHTFHIHRASGRRGRLEAAP